MVDLADAAPRPPPYDEMADLEATCLKHHECGRGGGVEADAAPGDLPVPVLDHEARPVVRSAACAQSGAPGPVPGDADAAPRPAASSGSANVTRMSRRITRWSCPTQAPAPIAAPAAMNAAARAARR